MQGFKQQRAIAKQIEKEVAKFVKLKAWVGHDEIASVCSKPPSA